MRGDYRATLAVGRRIDERWNFWAQYLFDDRVASAQPEEVPGLSGDAFSQVSHTVSADLEYSMTERASLAFAVSGRRGDVVSTTGQSAQIYYASKAVAEDPAFGPEFYAYKLNGTTYGVRVGINYSATISRPAWLRLRTFRHARRREQRLQEVDRGTHLELPLLNDQINRNIGRSDGRFRRCERRRAACPREGSSRKIRGADAVVSATPTDPKNAQRLKPPTDAVDQVDKQFVPYVKAVLVGSKVHFPNSDHIRHQVYSFSSAKKFELPLYGGTDAAPVVFDKPGVVGARLQHP